MKIITESKREGILCYIQVKDLLYLGQRGFPEFVGMYLNLINGNHTDTDFVRIVKKETIELLKNRDDIVDFMSFKDTSMNYISKCLINLNYGVFNDDARSRAAFMSNDFRDIMSFKKGELDYQIPLIVDGDVCISNLDATLEFCSTIYLNYYILKGTDNNLISDLEYQSFLLECVNQVYKDKYPEVELENRNYKIMNIGSFVVLIINNENLERQKTFKSFLLKKLRRKGKRDN